jgi:penicillin amidase
MKYIHLAIAALIFAAWIILGSTPRVGGAPLPGIGNFFNPGKGFWQNSKMELTDRTQQLTIAIDHPLAKGQVFFDEREVPHVFAENLNTASFLQGYVHAADRLWQMDLSTRATEGRLSEVLGARTQVRDKGQVSKGFPEAARRTAETMQKYFPEDYATLQAYADGFNAYVDQLEPEDYPVEYKILDHKPLRWSPYRTALLMKGMSQSLSGRNDDAAEAKTRTDLGEELFNALYPAHYPNADPVVPGDGTYARKAPGSGPALSTFAPQPFSAPAAPAEEFSSYQYDWTPSNEPAYTGLVPHPDNGSNNWAITGKRSNTGKPLLASDPHLSLTLPSIWAEVQIHYPGVNARGVGLPGAPGLMIGFNDHIAYGETNVGHDVTDWFKIEWTDSTRTKYRLDGEIVAADILIDTIIVRDAEPIIIHTPWTVFGPVPFTEGAYADHAMRYLAHDAPGPELRSHTLVGAFLRLMQATGYDDYTDALKGYVDPAQNFIFADRSGDIALRANGFFPIRAQGTGRFPLSGNTEANNWQGYIPFDQRPEHKNPERGFVASANQETTGPDYAYDFHGGFGEYRGRYINRHLSKEGKFTQRSMKELQLSSHSLMAEELTPLLIARINRNALTDDGARLLRLLSEWDYRCEGESRAATLFARWQEKLYQLTFDEFPRDSGYIRPETWRWNDLLTNQPNHPIFDIDSTRFKETAATLTQRVFDEILDDLEGELPETWAVHRGTKVKHLGAIPGFGSGLISSGGSRTSPRALSAGHGASWRMVVELGDTPRAWGTLPGGASGAPASLGYDNGLEEWANGRYHELTRWMSVEEAEGAAVGSWVFGN